MSRPDTPQSMIAPRPGRTPDQTPWHHLSQSEQRKQFLQCAMRCEADALVLREELAQCTVAGQRDNIQGALRRAIDRAKAYRRHAADLTPTLGPDALNEAANCAVQEGYAEAHGYQPDPTAPLWPWWALLTVLSVAVVVLATLWPRAVAWTILGLLALRAVVAVWRLLGRSGRKGGEQ